MLRSALILLLAMLAAACAAGDDLPGGLQATLPAPDKLALAAGPDTADYEIQPLDVIDISVFQVPDLTKTVEVSASGQISLPLIGAVLAAGKTTRGLESEIATKLRKDYLQAPQVTVFVKDYVSQTVTIDGAVGKPGVYPVKGRMSLLQALATAGGIDRSTADPRGVLVLRRVGGKSQGAKFDYAAISAGRATDPVIYAGDVIKVDQSGLRAAFKGLRESIPVFGLFTPLI